MFWKIMRADKAIARSAELEVEHERLSMLAEHDPSMQNLVNARRGARATIAALDEAIKHMQELIDSGGHASFTCDAGHTHDEHDIMTALIGDRMEHEHWVIEYTEKIAAQSDQRNAIRISVYVPTGNHHVN